MALQHELHHRYIHRKVIDLLGIGAYVTTNRTRPASIRKDMHTGRVFCFRPLDHTSLAA